MNADPQLLGVGVVVFATTNADDLVVLAALFADERTRPSSVVAGQLLGMTALVGLSALAAFGAMALPPPVVALVGVVPLALGIGKLVRMRGTDKADDAPKPRPSGRAAQILAVAGITLANGGDNLGVYVPLFAARPLVAIGYGALFLVLTVVWCLLGWWLVSNAMVARHVRRFSRVALPFVLVAVGLNVLRGALPLVVR